jgi:hypothetical protein
MTIRSLTLTIELMELASCFPVLAAIGQLANAIPALLSHF